MTEIFGFTLLKNGIKYDYPFFESLYSLNQLCQKIYLALGDSEDGTAEFISNSGLNLRVIPTVWDTTKRDGAQVLSVETNIALTTLRFEQKNKEAWGIYLQADEVFHEDDIELIKQDITKAQEEGHDAVSFCYYHFWESHSQVAINKKWYPHEIRAIKLACPAQSWGDAQSFRPCQKIYYSEARVFHYGHVREQDKYKAKKEDILKLYHSEEKMAKYQRRERRFDKMTECLRYLGTHPKIMKERILRLGEVWQHPFKEKLYIQADEKTSAKLTKDLLGKVHCGEIIIVSKISEVPKSMRPDCVILSPSFWEKFWYPSRVPRSMRSKLARPWTFSEYLMLKLSEKGFAQKVDL